MSGNTDAPSERTPDRSAKVRTVVIEALKNAEENNYLDDLAAMTIDEVVDDLFNYADMEDFTFEEVKFVVQAWRNLYI